ncbi:hypothetical protein, partial [Streptococcus hyovaginalis]
KDLVLSNTELNPFNNYLSNFWGSVQNDYLLISLYLVLCTIGIENKRYFQHFIPSIFSKGDLSDPDIAYQMEEVVLAVLTQENVAYYPDCIDTLNRVIKVTKHYQNKPILEMFKAKLALF